MILEFAVPSASTWCCCFRRVGLSLLSVECDDGRIICIHVAAAPAPAPALDRYASDAEPYKGGPPLYPF